MKVIKTTWGIEILYRQADRYSCKKLIVLSGKEIGPQCDEEKEKIIICLDGYGWIQQDYKLIFTQSLAEGKVIHITPQCVYRIGASADNVLELLEIEIAGLNDTLS